MVLLASSGSPPRMRGKECREYMGHLCPGITPAYAGKRRSIGRLSQPTRDHPRVCGEKSTRIAPKNCGSGSPPRMRGKDGVNDSAQAVTGITPAYAGKSWK